MLSMDLQSGTSFWSGQNREPDSYEALKENISCDVLIVGGGPGGLSAALRLAQLHKAKGGEVRVRYKTLDQLDGLCRRLNPAGES